MKSVCSRADSLQLRILPGPPRSAGFSNLDGDPSGEPAPVLMRDLKDANSSPTLWPESWASLNPLPDAGRELALEEERPAEAGRARPEDGLTSESRLSRLRS